MNNANFASLHAGMLERRAPMDEFSGGKVVKTLTPMAAAPIASVPAASAPVAGSVQSAPRTAGTPMVPPAAPMAPTVRANPAPPPIRSLLDTVADWTSLPTESESEGDFSRLYSQPRVPSSKTEPPLPERLSASSPAHLQPAHLQPAHLEPTLGQEFGLDEISDAGCKPKRRALTLRLAPDSHHRLRLASANTGRSCQDLLFTAMNKYLDFLDPGGKDEGTR